MPIESIQSVFARIVDTTELLMRDHSRKRSNAMTVRHIAALPAYLRRDIGLPDDADIVEVVEHGLARRPAGEEMRHHHAILPHAV